MDGDGCDSSLVLGVELLLILGEVVEDGVGDARCEDDGISVEDKRIVSFETIVAVETVQTNHAFSDGTVGVDELNVIILVEEVVLYLNLTGSTLAI
jgi:hypothetical protein